MITTIFLFQIILMGFMVAMFLIIYNMNKRSSGTQYEEIKNVFLSFEKNLLKTETLIKDEFLRNREENNRNSKEDRTEIGNSFKIFEDSILKRILEMANLEKSQFELFSNTLKESIKEFSVLQNEKFNNLTSVQSELIKGILERLENMRGNMDHKLKEIQEDNAKQLEKIRLTVDEKLHQTLETRLTESFKIVSDRLEQVQKGLGEMQTLASGVGDLKKVMSNIKTKGVLGEYQLESILEQTMTPNQFAKNVATKKGSNEKVEFAIKLPSKDLDDSFIMLPIDAKLPTEDYQVLLEAYDNADSTRIHECKKVLEQKIKKFAKDIRDKYIDPPNTTDFGIMFLPFEGLYAEVLRIDGLFEYLQRELKIIITGPTTISAFLNSLQMGFRTLAIEKRSNDVWVLLSAIKTEFSNFGEILEKTQKKLHEASEVISKAETRTRVIERKLKSVQELPQIETQKIFEQSSMLDGD